MNQLRHSAAEWCYFKNQYEPAEYYRRLKEIGYSGVEMVDPKRWALAKAAGLEVVNLGAPGMPKGMNHREHHDELLPRIREAIATASANRIPHVIVFSGNRDGQSDDAGIANCIIALKQLAGVAEKARVTLVFEVMNAFDHQDYHADRSAYAFAVIKAVGSPAVKVLYDIYHMQRMGENLLPTLLGNLDAIAHIHIAGSPKRDFPGADQEIDYAPIVRQVHAAGYRGYWGQEFVPTGDALDELARAHRQFTSYVKA